MHQEVRPASGAQTATPAIRADDDALPDERQIEDENSVSAANYGQGGMDLRATTETASTELVSPLNQTLELGRVFRAPRCITPSGHLVRRAFSCMFIPVLPRKPKLEHLGGPGWTTTESLRLALQVSEIGDRAYESISKPDFGRPVEHPLSKRNIRLALAGVVAGQRFEYKLAL
jgi:hypothetical protein